MLGLYTDTTYFFDSLNELSGKEKKCVKSLALVEIFNGIYSEEALIDCIIGNLHCTRKKAESLFRKLVKIGLRKMSPLDYAEISRIEDSSFSNLNYNETSVMYDLRKFACYRKYVTFSEHVDFCKRMKSYEE
jgi:hypothetical protein